MNIIKQYLKKCTEVSHTTLNPKGFGCVRIHLVPPKSPKPWIPWVVILNGYSVIPLQSSWAILLREFMIVLNEYHGKPLSDLDLNTIKEQTVVRMRAIFPKTDQQMFVDDLKDMLQTFKEVANGVEPSSSIGYMTLAKYAKYMKAPHRMDIMVSAMEKNGCWNCNQKCIHCYAANGPMANTKEMTTEELKKAIDKCKDACIPSITFTGGEATIRHDLVEIVDYARWFVTRLNTNGILLTKELCEKLYEASLDSLQVTLYSYDPEIHNKLVGGNHFDATINGIKNAIAAGLDVSINTPLCTLNSDYVKTIEFASKLGVRYFSSSGLIPAGNALKDESVAIKLTNEEITKIIKDAVMYATNNGLELAFTSPGWIDDKVLKQYNIVVPSCGACLSNMAIAPNGDVIPCQSWLGGEKLGNILTDKWDDIWNSKECKKIRHLAVTKTEVCLLKEN